MKNHGQEYLIPRYDLLRILSYITSSIVSSFATFSTHHTECPPADRVQLNIDQRNIKWLSYRPQSLQSFEKSNNPTLVLKHATAKGSKGTISYSVKSASSCPIRFSSSAEDEATCDKIRLLSLRITDQLLS